MPTTLYLATDDGPVVVTRRDERWTADRPRDLRGASCVAADPRRPERVVLGTWRDGAWRSDDAGATWRRAFEGMPHRRVTSVAVSGVERVGGRGVVYVGTEPSAVFRSEDGGESWRELAGLGDLPSSKEWSFPPRPETHHVRWLACDPHRPGRVHVAIEAGALVHTPDAGRTWRDRVDDGPYDTHQLAIHPTTPDHLWSAAGDGFYESDDGGATWRRREDGLPFTYCWSIALDPADPSTALLSAAPGPYQAHGTKNRESALFRRTADGTWQELQDGLPTRHQTRAPVVATNANEPGVFYTAADSGLYRSDDGGAGWRRLDVDGLELHGDTRVHALVAVEV